MKAGAALKKETDAGHCWDGFRPGDWLSSINVRDFIVRNVTPYTGDEAFLAKWLSNKTNEDVGRWISQRRHFLVAEEDGKILGAAAMLDSGKIKEATAILELDAELNPQSDWGRYLLGVAHATGGEKEKARADFQKVLELNPKNAMAKKRLEDLDKPAK